MIPRHPFSPVHSLRVVRPRYAQLRSISHPLTFLVLVATAGLAVMGRATATELADVGLATGAIAATQPQPLVQPSVRQGVQIAQAGVMSQVTDTQMQKILRGMGFELTVMKANRYRFQLDGYTVVLFNEGENMQLYAGFKNKASLQQINEWNKTKRFSRAYIDDEGDAVIEADLDFAGGVTKETIEEFIKTFRGSVQLFTQALNE